MNTRPRTKQEFEQECWRRLAARQAAYDEKAIRQHAGGIYPDHWINAVWLSESCDSAKLATIAEEFNREELSLAMLGKGADDEEGSRLMLWRQFCGLALAFGAKSPLLIPSSAVCASIEGGVSVEAASLAT